MLISDNKKYTAAFARNLLAAAALAALSACAGARSKPEQVSYLDAAIETVQPAPAPAPGSETDKTDLATLRDWQLKRTPAQCAAAAAQPHATYEEFFGQAGLFGTPTPPAVSAFFDRLHHELYLEVTVIKKRNARPRPYNRDASLSPCLGKWDDYAYPSGHALNSRVFADILSELAPSRTGEFRALSDQAALNRVIGGVHHPSDIEAGKLLGDRLFAEYMKNPAFRADLEGLRKYLR